MAETLVCPEPVIGPRNPRLGAAAARVSLPVLRALYAAGRMHGPASRFARGRAQEVRGRLARGERVHLVGIGPAGHNSGVALIEASLDGGVRVLCNHEEERFSGVKHSTAFPAHAIAALLRTMDEADVARDAVTFLLGSWDYARLGSLLLRTLAEELPQSWSLARPSSIPKLNASHLFRAGRAAARCGRRFGRGGALPIVGMPHHDNHAWFSFGVSPFAREERPVMVTALDGTGDAGAISLYVATRSGLRRLRGNDSVFDSLGMYYSVLSSTQGGWTMLSSEGRYMGAAAWGDLDRRTNPFYAALRQIFRLGPEGEIRLNRALANWPRGHFARPYTAALARILGPPIAPRDMWNPDLVLRAEDAGRPDEQARFDRAAAVQLVFEDALFHVIEHLVRRTGSDRLVLTGGTALNALANLRVLERFDEAFYERHLGRKDTRLHVWIPPTPGDAGVAMGAAYAFACQAGAPFGPPLEHAFLCGFAPRAREIRAVLAAAPDVGWVELGDTAEPERLDALADLLAFVTAHDGVAAIFQGAAETGPRALGHRSIVANPCNPRTLEVLNRQVKHREAVRPLAPMATLDGARRWFDLPAGAADADYDAYSYMVLVARARPGARERIPAVVHRDGTGRVQIVRARHDPFTHAYLQALGRRIGVEVAVNTSFNVAGPIVQTPEQALAALRRSRGLDAVLFVAADGPAYAAWHDVVAPPKDAGRRFRAWLAAWRAETRDGLTRPSAAVHG